MRRILFLFFIGTYVVNAQVGIGTTNPSASAMLEVSSLSSDGSYKGFMPPRVTVVQRDLIRADESDLGLLIFVSDPVASIYGLQVWNGVFWENVHLLQNSIQPTEVAFTSTSRDQIENSGAIDLEFNITNPSLTAPINITISASAYNDLDESLAQVVTIPAATPVFNASSIFRITNDDLVEGNEVINFSITNVSGGSGAPTIGINSSFLLTVIDDDIKVWINEIHYDNIGGDIDERVEIAGSAGVDLTGYSIVHYNGANGAVISTSNITGSIPDQQAGLGTLNINIPLQNDIEGIALVDPLGGVIQFLSYEGVITATAGPANGMTSIQLPLDENIAPEIGFSLQLVGAGNQYSDFIWAAGIANSIGQINLGQIFN
ncbi:hypothetical protein [Leeuwenhoekiella sp. W20_SRS_FM14]|uniref:hypothetical protein n=1 Tax=Leeuwenhoekiella sp. W20_SRS_FM14 TaxID=3240270 RepID=UPI003F9C97EB